MIGVEYIDVLVDVEVALVLFGGRRFGLLPSCRATVPASSKRVILLIACCFSVPVILYFPQRNKFFQEQGDGFSYMFLNRFVYLLKFRKSGYICEHISE